MDTCSAASCVSFGEGACQSRCARFARRKEQILYQTARQGVRLAEWHKYEISSAGQGERHEQALSGKIEKTLLATDPVSGRPGGMSLEEAGQVWSSTELKTHNGHIISAAHARPPHAR